LTSQKNKKVRQVENVDNINAVKTTIKFERANYITICKLPLNHQLLGQFKFTKNHLKTP